MALEPSVIRIFGNQGKVVGTGFLALDRAAVTCAHVIVSACGLPGTPAIPPAEPVWLDFPLLQAGERFSARVIFWEPDIDIAGLEIAGVLPAGARPAALVWADSVYRHPFRAFGFPFKKPDGVWADGEMQAATAAGWVQIKDIGTTGYFVQPGFSGGPVWDETLTGVVGMVIAADMTPGVRAGYIIPSHLLTKTWPDLPRPALFPEDKYAAPFVLPQKDVSSFTGRGEELKLLERLLITGSGDKLCSIVGVAGTGGIGKSALAAHFAELYKTRFPDGVFGIRVDGKTPESIAREFARLLKEEIDPEDERGPGEIMQELFQHRRALLIFDNAEDVSIRELLPGSERCAVMITTRDRGLPLLLDVSAEGRIDLPPLPDPDSLLLLERIVGKARISGEPAAAGEICGLVGNLPLALQIAGAALAMNPARRLADYAASLREEKARLARLKIRGDLHLDVRASFSLSLKLLEAEEVDYFARLSICAADGFSIRAAMSVQEIDRVLAEDYLSDLYRLSLINLSQTDTSRYVFHPLLRLFAQELAEEKGITEAAAERHARYFSDWVKSSDLTEPAVTAAVIEELDDILLASEYFAKIAQPDYELVILLEPLLVRSGYWENAVRLMTVYLQVAEKNQDTQGMVQLRIQQAKFRALRGSYTEAYQILEPLESIIEQIEPLGLQYRCHAMWLNTFGGILQRQGRFSEAVDAFQRSEKIEHQLGNERGQAKVLTSLGGVLQRQGRFDEAVDAFKQSEVIEHQLGNERGQALVLNSLGGALQRQGRFDEAVDTLQRSYAILQKQGDQHGQAMVLTSLGGVLQRQGRFDEAIDSFKQSEVIEHQLGNERGQGMVLNSLGGVLQRQGRFDEAVDAFQRSYAISEKLGDQRSLAMVLNSLGGVLQRQGRFDEAVDAFQRSYAISEKLGDQRSLAMVLNSLGGVLQRQGRFDEALDAFQRSYDLLVELEDLRGQAMVLNSLGGVLQRQGRFDKAVDAFQRSYDLLVELEDLRGQAMVLNSLGGVLQRQGRFDEAVDAFQRSYAISENLGDERSLAMVLNSLGGVLQRQGRFDKALDAFQRSSEIGEELRDYRHLAIVLNSLGGVLQRQGRFDEALNAFHRSYNLLVKLEDLRGQAMVLNSQGGVLDRMGRFDEAIKAFQRSSEIGEALGDERHLTQVYTAWGKALLYNNHPGEAVEKLQKSFAIDERQRNRRGLNIVAEVLIEALIKNGSRTEAIAYCERALAVIPENRKIRAIRERLAQSAGGVETAIYQKGTVKALYQNQKGYLYGFITPEGGGTDIYFQERNVDSGSLAALSVGCRVDVDVEQAEKGPRARKVIVYC